MNYDLLSKKRKHYCCYEVRQVCQKHKGCFKHEYLKSKGVYLLVLNMGGDKIDTGSAIGKLMITVLSGIAKFEADMIKERQLEGIQEAKQRGVYKGRPKKYTENNRGFPVCP